MSVFIACLHCLSVFIACQSCVRMANCKNRDCTLHCKKMSDIFLQIACQSCVRIQDINMGAALPKRDGKVAPKLAIAADTSEKTQFLESPCTRRLQVIVSCRTQSGCSSLQLVPLSAPWQVSPNSSSTEIQRLHLQRQGPASRRRATRRCRTLHVTGSCSLASRAFDYDQDEKDFQKRMRPPCNCLARLRKGATVHKTSPD